MTNPVFLVSPGSLKPGIVLVDGDEGRHAATVKRIRVAEFIDLADGKGMRATGEVVAVGRDFLEVKIAEVTQVKPSAVQITAVQALAKGERAELAIEISTEVGADTIIAWKSEHCIAKWDDSGKTLAKWQRIAREAAKQSRRSFVPDVIAAITTNQLIEELKSYDAVFVLHETAEVSLAAATIPQKGNIAVVTGPEGGISPTEIDVFTQAGFKIVRMGETVMRTSTAGAIAMAVIAAKTARW